MFNEPWFDGYFSEEYLDVKHTPLTADRKARMLRKYGVQEGDYDAVLAACGGRCPLCLKPFSTTRLVCLDHNHETGLWRGLLCTPCNNELGMRHDDAGWFRRAAEYLDNPPTLHEAIVVYVPGSIGAHRAER